MWVFSTLQKSAITRSKAPLSPTPAPRQAGNTRATCRGVVDKATGHPAAHTRMTGKFFIDVVGGSGFLSQATHHLGLRGCVLDTKFGPRCDVAQPFVLTKIRQDVSAGKMRRRKDLTSTTTPRALPKLFPPLLPPLTCFIAHAVDSGTPL